MSEVRYINMTPTWPEAVEMLLAVMENGTPEGVEMAKAEFRRMGQICASHQAMTTGINAEAVSRDNVSNPKW